MTTATSPVQTGPVPMRRPPAFWTTLGLLVLGLLLTGHEFVPRLIRFPIAMTTALVLFSLHGLLLFLIIRSLDYLEPEPPLLLATALAWGALVATSLALIANNQVSEVLIKLVPPHAVATWGDVITGPTVEEALKALGIVMIVLLAGHHLNSVADGMVYGACVGLGFQEIENIHYAIKAVASGEAGDTTIPVIGTFLVRGLFNSLGSHVVWSAFAGAGIAWAYLRRDRTWPARIAVALLGFTGAWAAHLLWNSPLGYDGGPLNRVVCVSLVLVVAGAIARPASRDEAGVYLRRLRDLADPEIATDAEITTLRSPVRRFAARWDAYVRGGAAALRAARRLHRAQAALAVALVRHDARHDASCDDATDLRDTTGAWRGPPGGRLTGIAGPARRAAIRTARQALIAAGRPQAAGPRTPRRGTVAGWAALAVGLAGPAGLAISWELDAVPLELSRLAVVMGSVAGAALVPVLLCAGGVRRARRSGRPADARLGAGLLLGIAGLMLALVLGIAVLGLR